MLKRGHCIDQIFIPQNVDQKSKQRRRVKIGRENCPTTLRLVPPHRSPSLTNLYVTQILNEGNNLTLKKRSKFTVLLQTKKLKMD